MFLICKYYKFKPVRGLCLRRPRDEIILEKVRSYRKDEKQCYRVQKSGPYAGVTPTAINQPFLLPHDIC